MAEQGRQRAESPAYGATEGVALNLLLEEKERGSAPEEGLTAHQFFERRFRGWSLAFSNLRLFNPYTPSQKGELLYGVPLTAHINLALPFLLDGRPVGRMRMSLASVVRYFTFIPALPTVSQEKRTGVVITPDPKYYRQDIPLAVDKNIGVVRLDADAVWGDPGAVIDAIAWVKRWYPRLQVIAGGIRDADGILRLIAAGADAIQDGDDARHAAADTGRDRIGASSAPRLYHTARIASERGIPVISGSGVRDIWDAFTALALGASSVVLPHADMIRTGTLALGEALRALGVCSVYDMHRLMRSGAIRMQYIPPQS